MSSTWRAFALRRLLGRLHIDEEIVRHLSTFQRLGETLEIAAPTEMLPVGARTVFRAVRTRAAAQIRPDWLWPRWLERQLDPTDPAFTPRGHLPALQNVTGRNWTMVGSEGSAWESVVDPRGSLTPWFDGWSLEWWVEASGRWHLPGRDPSLRQHLLDATPVVTTEIEVEGAVVAHRAYGAGGERVAVEIVNRTPAPVRIVLAVRPYNPEGLAVVERIELEGREVVIDGRVGLELPDPLLGVAVGTFKSGDSLDAARAGAWAAPGGEPRVSDPAGLAQAAFLYELGPGEALRATVPIAPTPRRRRARSRHRPVPPASPTVAPPSEEVAEGWRHRLAEGTQVVLPDPRLQEAVDANRAYLLLLHDPGDITAGPFTYHRFWFRDAAYQVAALSRWGFTDEAADVLRSYPDRQRADGFFYSQWREWDANGAAIWTIAEHHRLTRDDELLASLAPAVGKGARWIARACASDRGKAPEAKGLLPAGVSAEHLGPFDYYYWDDLWAWRGLLDAASIARWCDQPDAAEEADRAARALRRTLLASFQQTARRMGRTVVPAGPARGIDAGMIGSLAACYPLGLLEPHDDWIQGTADVIREELCLGDAFYQGISHTGLGTYLTLQLAFVELMAGDPACLRRLRWLLDAATDTFTWPEAIHPQLGVGCMGDGHHGWMAADLLNFVRMLLVRETAEGLILLGLLPHSWRGGRIEVRDAPTHHGPLTYCVDWREDSPILSWRLAAREPGLRISALGLDPGWSSHEAEGEAVLNLPRGGGDDRPRDDGARS